MSADTDLLFRDRLENTADRLRATEAMRARLRWVLALGAIITAGVIVACLYCLTYSLQDYDQERLVQLLDPDTSPKPDPDLDVQRFWNRVAADVSARALDEFQTRLPAIEAAVAESETSILGHVRGPLTESLIKGLSDWLVDNREEVLLIFPELSETDLQYVTDQTAKVLSSMVRERVAAFAESPQAYDETVAFFAAGGPSGDALSGTQFERELLAALLQLVSHEITPVVAVTTDESGIGNP